MDNQGEFYAQYGEDRILAGIFSGVSQGIAVEVGAFDGIVCSNSYHFERKGWTCVLVEPNPELASRIRQSRPMARLYQCAVGSSSGKITLQIPEGGEMLASVNSNASDLGEMTVIKAGKKLVPGVSVPLVQDIDVEMTTLDHVLEQAGVDHVDFMTIDIEGFELDALRGISLDRWKPRIVIIEDNHYGADHAIADYMALQGYRRFRITGCNDWYARRDDRKLVNGGRLLAARIKKALMYFGRSLLLGSRRVASRFSPG